MMTSHHFAFSLKEIHREVTMDFKELLINFVCFALLVCVCFYLLALTYRHAVEANIERQNNSCLVVTND